MIAKVGILPLTSKTAHCVHQVSKKHISVDVEMVKGKLLSQLQFAVSKRKEQAKSFHLVGKINKPQII